RRMSRRIACSALSFVVVAVASVVAACGAPTNPCDPDAPADVQAQGTKLAGTVVDQDGNGVAGVAVGIAGRAEAQVSREGGVFTSANLPPRSTGYELTTTPAAPLVGGRVTSPPLVCGAQLAGVTVGVVVPPSSPEIEIVQASTEASVFAAFGST